MVSKYSIDPASLTTVLTSCGRFDLLSETVSSFLAHFDPGKIVIAEDSESTEGAQAFARAFPLVDMRPNVPRLGQLRSIDKLYATVTTPFALHLEDDWRFTRSVDLDRIIAFLEARPDISVVCIAHRIYDPRYARSAHRAQHGGIDYLVWDLDAHPKWFSYSFNPSVARLALWRELGPFERFLTEESLSLFCKERGLRIAMVAPGAADHIGDGRHAPDPFQPARPRTLVSRLRRSVAKRWFISASGERSECL